MKRHLVGHTRVNLCVMFVELISPEKYTDHTYQYILKIKAQVRNTCGDCKKNVSENVSAYISNYVLLAAQWLEKGK